MGRVKAREFLLKDGRRGVVRSAEVGDAEGVLRQLGSVLEEGEFTVTTLPADGLDITVEKERERIVKHLEDGGKVLAVAEVGGQIVGSADLHCGVRRRIAHVAQLGITVMREFRGVGVGRALMGSVLEWAAGHAVIEKVGLGVFANNTAAIGLYRKMGFVEEGRRVNEIKVGQGEYVDSILMYRFVK